MKKVKKETKKETKKVPEGVVKDEAYFEKLEQDKK
jgi:hypothetical protein